MPTSLFVCRVIRPGTRIDGAPNEAWEAGKLVDELVHQSMDAGIAFVMFEEANAALRHAHSLAATQRQRPSLSMRRKPILHARTFVFALDHFDRTLVALAKQAGAPSALSAIHDEFRRRFPGLRPTRDSAHHRDERLQGQERGRPIALQPVQTASMSAPAGALMIVDCLEGTKFTCTGADGNIAQVDVSLASLQCVVKAAQDVVNQYPWKGPPCETSL